MIVGALSPDHGAGQSVERVSKSADVAEERDDLTGTGLQRPDSDAAPHDCRRFVGPVDATGLGVKGVNVTRIAADENSSIHAGLPIKSRRAGESERPLELQPRYLAGSQTRGFCRLEARIRKIAPSVPRGGFQVDRRHTAGAGVGHVLDISGIVLVELPAPKILGDQALIVVVQTRRHILHYTGGNGVVDRLGRHRLEGGFAGSVFDRISPMAARATVLEHTEPAPRRSCRPPPPCRDAHRLFRPPPAPPRSPVSPRGPSPSDLSLPPR